MSRTALLTLGFLAMIATIVPGGANAQFFKGKTITMIVNYPAGGPTDLEGRIVAQHLPAHLPGNPTVIVKNIGGASGILGSNELGLSAPDGATIGFQTLDVVSQILENPGLKVPYYNFVFVAGVESPLVVYARRDIPPGLATAADIMKTNGFKALSLNAENSNTLNMDLSLDLLGVKYEPIPAYRGLKEVETAILQNIGQVANTSVSGWTGSLSPTMSNVVLPLWQLSPRKNGAYPRTKAVPDIQTFEEFYNSVRPDKPLAGQTTYRVLRTMSDPQLAMFRVVLLPPKTPDDTVAAMRAAFVELWQDKSFLADYSNVVKLEPVLVTGRDGQDILSGLARVPSDVKSYLTQYIANLTSK